MFHAQAARRPGSPALTFEGRTYTFAELAERSARVANALVAAGVGAGDRVAILSKNSPVFYELLFGCNAIAATVVGLNWRLVRAETVAIVRDAEPSLVVAAPDLVDLLDLDELAARGTPVITLDDAYDAWLADAPSTDIGAVGSPDDVAFILYTSGTTGLPKGAMLTNANMSYTARIASEVWGFGPDSVNLVAMPLFHIGGIGYGLMALTQGGHTVVSREADPATLISLIERHRVTHSFFVPAVVQSLLSDGRSATADFSSLELLVYGASPIAETQLREALDVLGCRFTQAYGMTETAGTVVSLPPEDHDPGSPRSHLLRSCGLALPWLEVRITDPPSGAEATVGEVGEIWIRSGQNMKGYRNNPVATGEALTPEGWLRTGDAAYRDDEGYIYLVDRIKDMIISGGENVYPAEVENALIAHPAVEEVAVIGVPDPRWGETVKAIVVLGANRSATAEEIVGFARKGLAKYKCPTSVDFVDSLPRNASGKVLKKELRKEYWKSHDREIG
ncbi:MAG: fatty acid--CoA ligase [Acidimicrobiales bacterium]